MIGLINFLKKKKKKKRTFSKKKPRIVLVSARFSPVGIKKFYSIYTGISKSRPTIFCFASPKFTLFIYFDEIWPHDKV